MKLLQVFQTRLEAEWAADKLTRYVQEILDRYGRVSVVDVYDLMYNITGLIEFCSKSYTDNKYGWTEDPCIQVYRARSWGYSTYGLELSDPKLLEEYIETKNEHSED